MFQTPLGPWIFSLFAFVFLSAVDVFMAGAAIASLRVSVALGLFLGAICAFMIALTAYVWRDLRGRSRLRVVLNADSVSLDLPAGRSLIHRPPKVRLIAPYNDVAAVETRLEAYRSFGTAIMQRAYALRRKSGDRIFLFEDRALATALQSATYPEIAEALAARIGVGVIDLGMVEGRGGILGVWGAHAPDWTTPSLPPMQQRRLWERAAATGSAALIAASTPPSAWYGGLRLARRSPNAPAPSKAIGANKK